MAEINIVRKPPMWPWLGTIAGVIIVAVLLVWLAGRNNDDESADARAASAPGAATATAPATADEQVASTTGRGASEPAAIRQYLEFSGVVSGGGSAAEMGVEHDYTAAGIRKLDAALQALVDARGDERSRSALSRASLDAAADRLQRDEDATNHVGILRSAFRSAADVIATVQGGESAAQPLRSAADALDANRPLLSQEEAVKTGFHRAAEAIRAAWQQA